MSPTLQGGANFASDKIIRRNRETIWVYAAVHEKTTRTHARNARTQRTHATHARNKRTQQTHATNARNNSKIF